jgi:outer membrane protein assembly factor BamB
MSHFPETRNTRVVSALFVALSVLLLATSAAGQHLSSRFNRPGNILIADQFNNRVIEVDPNGDIVWHFGLGPADFSPKSIIGVNDAQRVGELTLMAGTGTPGAQPEAPNCVDPAGCPDNRVLLVDRAGHIVWQYGQFGPGGAADGQLNTPVQTTWLPRGGRHEGDDEDSGEHRGIPRGHVLITDQANERIIEVNLAMKKPVWQYGTTGVTGSGPGFLNNPNCAELLENGHILICDENNNQALEVTNTTPSTIIHTFTIAGGMLFNGVAFASRLPNGHTLITDSGNARIVETDENGNVFWQYFTNTELNSNPRGGTGPLPTRALRLRNGNTLISDQYNHRVIEVSPDFQIVRTFGKINSLGYNTQSVAGGGLNSPYDAKRIGDYTGITPPFGFEHGDRDEQGENH